MKLKIRRSYTIVENRLSEAGKAADTPLRKVAAVLVVENPYAGRYVTNLDPLISASAAIGREIAAIAIAALAPYKAQSVGKAALVGIAGEQEHANALLTTAFAEPLRDALGGGKAWISSMTKVAMAGTPSLTHCSAWTSSMWSASFACAKIPSMRRSSISRPTWMMERMIRPGCMRWMRWRRIVPCSVPCTVTSSQPPRHNGSAAWLI